MIYIHVPFCVSRCIYCDFYSTVQSADMRTLYVEAACHELKNRINYLPENNTNTIYFGGGTPSQLTLAQLSALLETIHAHYNIHPQAEITLEANPDDINPTYVSELIKLGINRISLGVQSFDDDTLHLLRRRHNANQAIQAVNTIVEAGINNVSIDLIYGLPYQTENQFAKDLNQAFALPITHLSTYALSIEPHTALSQMLEQKRLRLPTEDSVVSEYNLLMEQAATHGFEHYEISNFALPHYHSRHNSGYWDGTPYLGIGPGAHSYDGKMQRRYNLPDLKAYVAAPGKPPHEVEKLTTANRFDEFVFTSLRTQRGLDLNRLKQAFGTDWHDELLQAARPHILSHHLTITEDNRLRLSPQAIMISDDIMSDLMRG